MPGWYHHTMFTPKPSMMDLGLYALAHRDPPKLSSVMLGACAVGMAAAGLGFISGTFIDREARGVPWSERSGRGALRKIADMAFIKGTIVLEDVQIDYYDRGDGTVRVNVQQDSEGGDTKWEHYVAKASSFYKALAAGLSQDGEGDGVVDYDDAAAFFKEEVAFIPGDFTGEQRLRGVPSIRWMP